MIFRVCLELIYSFCQNLAVSSTFELFRCYVLKKMKPTVSSFNEQLVRIAMYP